MKNTKRQFFYVLIALTAVLYSCDLNELENRETYLDLPKYNYNYSIGVQDDLPTLGRVLFYDPRLSVNNSASCSSCHKQELAFADNTKLSRGFKGELTERNSMPIQNIVSTFFPVGVNVDASGSFKSTSLFWDGRRKDILSMVLDPIQNHIEMGVNNLDDLEKKVSTISDYGPLFAAAFGSTEVSKDRIATALSAFVVSIRSTGSRFDQSLTNGFSTLNPIEQMGRDLFFSTYNCNSCHQLQEPVNGYQVAAQSVGATVEVAGFADIGLDANPTDPGVYKESGIPSDLGKFKIPSLRNVALTAPYMHDGRFQTLEDVVEHYSTDIEKSANLDTRLRDANGNPKQFNIPASDKEAIVAFLKSLTDYQLLTDPKFSNPFKLK